MSPKELRWWVAPGIIGLLLAPLSGWSLDLLLLPFLLLLAIVAAVALVGIPLRASRGRPVSPLLVNISLCAATWMVGMDIVPGYLPPGVRWAARPVTAALEYWKTEHGDYPAGMDTSAMTGGWPSDWPDRLGTGSGFSYLGGGAGYTLLWGRWRHHAYRSDSRQWCDYEWDKGHAPYRMVFSHCD